MCRQVLAEEQWKISALEHLSQAASFHFRAFIKEGTSNTPCDKRPCIEAIASKDIAALEAALSEAENAGVEAVEPCRHIDTT